MRRVDFENGGIIPNIVQSAFPMLIAQVLNLLYNIVDRIYIARIPEIGTAALGAVGLCFPVIVIITAFSNLFGSGGAPLFRQPAACKWAYPLQSCLFGLGSVASSSLSVPLLPPAAYE